MTAPITSYICDELLYEFVDEFQISLEFPLCHVNLGILLYHLFSQLWSLGGFIRNCCRQLFLFHSLCVLKFGWVPLGWGFVFLLLLTQFLLIIIINIINIDYLRISYWTARSTLRHDKGCLFKYVIVGEEISFIFLKKILPLLYGLIIQFLL